MTREERLAQIKKEREERKARESRLQEMKNERAAAKKSAAASVKKALALPGEKAAQPQSSKFNPVSFGDTGGPDIPKRTFTGERSESAPGFAAMREAPYRSVLQEEDFASTVAEMRENRFRWDDLIPKFNNMGARGVVSAIQSGTLDDIQKQYSYLTEDQQNILLYYGGKEDWEKATEYLDFLERGLNAQAARAQEEQMKKMAEENPVMWSLLSPAASVLGGAIAAGDLASQNIRRAITGKEVDYNSEGQRIGQMVPQIRQTVSEDIKDGADLEIGGRNVASLLYNTAMSGADSLAASGFGKVASLLLGSGAGVAGARDVAARGGSDSQALISGVASGVFEGLFESYSLGNLRALKEMPVGGIKDLVLNIAKSTGVNASEEFATEVSNIVFDALTMGDISYWESAIKTYMANGLDEKSARKQAAKDLFGQSLEAAASGALMGAAFGGIGSAAGALNNRNYQEPQLAAEDDRAERSQLLQNALEVKENGVPAQEQVAPQIAQTAPAEISGKEADRIMADPARMAELGIDTNGMTKRQARSAVKQAVSRLASPQSNGTAQGRAETLPAAQGTQNATSGRINTVLSNDTVPASPALTDGQMNAMHGAAQADNGVTSQTQAEYNAIAKTEGMTNGKEVYLRDSGQRAGSAYPGGQVSAVEESTGRNQRRQAAGRPADSGAAALTYGEKVSTASLGIGGGSSKNTVRILKGGDTQFTAEAKKLAKQRGLRVILFAGDNLSIRQKDGQMASVRGYITGDRVFIRADHPLYTADQIMRHEVGHDMIAKGEINPGTVRERIAQTHGKEKVSQLSQMYVEAYEGAGMTPNEIWEEVICDSLGDMNIFAGATRESAAGEFLREGRQATQAETVENRQERGPPTTSDNAKTSIETLPDGKKYVRADRQVIFGNDPDSWSEQLEDYINGKIRRGQDVQLIAEDGDILVLTAQTAGKVSSPYRDAARMSDAAFERKVNAGTHIDELARVSMRGNRVVADEDAKHGESASGGWNYRTAYFLDFDGKYYECTISVSMSEGGNKVYNIGKMKERRFPTVQNALNGSSTRGGAQREKTSSEISMPQTERDVKGNFSRELDSDSSPTDDQRQTQTELQEEIRAEVRAQLERMGKEYGWIPAGENPSRSVQIPARTEQNKKVSQTARTILEARATPDEMVPNIEKLVADGDLSYDPISDKKAVTDAEETIRRLSYTGAYAAWASDMKKGVVSKENTTMGWLLYNNAANSGDTALALNILNEMVKSQRSAAQALQATRILKTLSPETQLYGVQKSVDGLTEELKKRYGDDIPGLTIDPAMAEKFLNAKTDKGRAEAIQEIYRDIGRQMPSRFMDKFNAWRYLAMLGNPRTHVRNIIGNAGFAPVVAVKNLTATAIESLVLRNSDSRTKSVALASKEGRALLKAAWADYANVTETMPDGKYSDFKNANRYIEEGRVIFGRGEGKTAVGRALSKSLGRAAEKVRRFNSGALAYEDMWFAQPHYASALAQYCKAHGITVEELQRGGTKRVDVARNYAMREAQKATYQDANEFSEFFARLGRNPSNKKTAKAMNALVEGVLPFRKTPANILVRSVEYSPLGLVRGLKNAVFDVRKGNVTAAEAIDRISAGLTGTALLGLGVWLAAEGLVRGHGDDEKDKEKDFSELQGHQNYALELPNGTSATLDWLAPEALPFFIGVNLWEMTSGMQEAPTMADILGAVSNVSEPLLEMSCLQGLNDLLDSVGYASSEGLASLPQVLVSSSTSLLTQMVPTLLGQIERSVETRRMTTYTDKNTRWLTPDMQYFFGRVTSRIPGIDFGQIPYIDAWGREESSGGPFERAFNNFLNPAYMSEVNVSAVEQELERLYGAVGETDILPSRAPKYFTVNEERKDLTGAEYVEYATYRGERAYDLLAELTSSRQYNRLSDALKYAAVKKCYSVANEEAKALVSEFEPEKFHKDMAKVERAGVSNIDYILFYVAVNEMSTVKDSKGNTIRDVQSQVREWLKNSGYNRKQKEALWATRYSSAY